MLERGLVEGVDLKLLKLLLAAALIGLLFASLALCQDPPEPVRLRFARGKHTTTVTGFVGGEATDRYVVHVRANQKLIVHAISRRKRTQVSVFAVDDDSDILHNQSDNDLTRWAGKVPRTGDYVIQVNVHPYAERYTLKVTVR